MIGVQIVNAIGQCKAEACGPMAFLVTIAQVARFANEFLEWLKLRHKYVVWSGEYRTDPSIRFLTCHFAFRRKRFCGTAGFPPARATLTVILDVCVCRTRAGGT